MIKRPLSVKVRLTPNELSALTTRAKESGYSREAYIRSLMDGQIPRLLPPPTYHDMMRELHGIGRNLNQIAQKAHVLNVLDVARYDAALRLFMEVVAQIEEAIILPMKAR